MRYFFSRTLALAFSLGRSQSFDIANFPPSHSAHTQRYSRMEHTNTNIELELMWGRLCLANVARIPHWVLSWWRIRSPRFSLSMCDRLHSIPYCEKVHTTGAAVSVLGVWFACYPSRQAHHRRVCIAHGNQGVAIGGGARTGPSFNRHIPLCACVCVQKLLNRFAWL